jgi:hypothetical protein
MTQKRSVFLTIALVIIAPAVAHPSVSHAAETITDRAAGPPLTDGSRWLAFASSSSSVRVVDDETGRSYDARVPCTPSTSGNPLAAIGGGQAMIGCAYSRGDLRGDSPLLLDLETGTWHAIPGADSALARFALGATGSAIASPVGVGARWAAITVSDYRNAETIMRDWRTGAIGPDETTSSAPDLDAPELNVALCSPLVHRDRFNPNAVIQEGPRFDALLYRWPYAVNSGLDEPLTLQRCGNTATIELEPARPLGVFPARDIQFAAEVVSWTSGAHERLYLPACSIRLSRQEVAYGWAHTSNSLYRGLEGPRGWRIERTPLPRCEAARHAVVLRMESHGRRAAPRPVTGRWPASSGFEAEPLALPGEPLPRLSVVPSATIGIRAESAIRALRWRVGHGTWHEASGRDRHWHLTVPARLRATRTLTLDLRPRAGGRAEQQLLLAPRGRR